MSQKKVLLLLLWCFAGLSHGSLLAQRNGRTSQGKNYREFEIGDEVVIVFLGSIHDGVVLDRNTQSKKVKVEFTFGLRPKQEIFDWNAVRYRWEREALSDLRSWSDLSGENKIVAAAMRFDATKVYLRKMDSETLIGVPYDKLSERDQKFIAELRAVLPPSLPEETEVVMEGTPLNSGVMQARSDFSLMQPDPPERLLELSPGGIAFPRPDFFSSITYLEPLGGSKGWLLAGLAGQGLAENPPKILWGALRNKKLERFQVLPYGERIAGCLPSKQLVATVTDKKTMEIKSENRRPKEDSYLTLWKASPATGHAEGIFRLKVSNKLFVGLFEGLFVKFIDDERLVVQTGENVYSILNFVTHEEVAYFIQDAFRPSPPVLSPNKRYMVIAGDDAIDVVDLQTMDLIAHVPHKSFLAPAVGFSADGNRLAVYGTTGITIYDLAREIPPKEYSCASHRTDHFNDRSVHFIDDRYLLLSSARLYDMEKELVVWLFEAAPFEIQNNLDLDPVAEMFGDKLVYATETRGSNRVFVIGDVELPGKEVLDALKDFDYSSIYAMEP